MFNGDRNREKRLAFSVEGTGYTKSFKIYHGKEKRLIPAQQDVVMHLTTPLYGKGHTIALDRGFTCPELVQRLHNERFNVVGTVQGNRKFLPRDLNKHLKMKKGEIKSMNSGIINYIAWEDVRTVRLLSTIHDTECIVDKKTNPFLRQ